MIDIHLLIGALAFYADDDNYWGRPLSLDEDYDRRTLKASSEAHKASKIMKDRGKLAKDLLKLIESKASFTKEFIENLKRDREKDITTTEIN